MGETLETEVFNAQGGICMARSAGIAWLRFLIQMLFFLADGVTYEVAAGAVVMEESAIIALSQNTFQEIFIFVKNSGHFCLNTTVRFSACSHLRTTFADSHSD